MRFCSLKLVLGIRKTSGLACVTELQNNIQTCRVGQGDLTVFADRELPISGKALVRGAVGVDLFPRHFDNLGIGWRGSIAEVRRVFVRESDRIYIKSTDFPFVYEDVFIRQEVQGLLFADLDAQRADVRLDVGR